MGAFQNWEAVDILRSSTLNLWFPMASCTKRLFLLSCPEVKEIMARNGWPESSQVDAVQDEQPWIVFEEEYPGGRFREHTKALPMLTTYGKTLAEQYGAISCEGCVVLMLSDTVMHAGTGPG